MAIEEDEQGNIIRYRLGAGGKFIREIVTAVPLTEVVSRIH